MSDTTIFGGGRSRRVGVNPVTIVNQQGVQQIRPAGAAPGLIYFTDDGTPTGDEDQATNSAGYTSGSPGIFYLQAPAGTVMHITQINFSLVDTNMEPSRWGGIMGGLTNGIRVIKRIGTIEILDFLSGRAYQTNKDLTEFSTDYHTYTYGALAEQIKATWDIKGAMGGNATLDGDTSENLAVLIQDDITGLGSQATAAVCYTMVK